MCKWLASTWCAFAATGDPNNTEIPNWPSYDASMRATIIFDTTTRVENDPRGEPPPLVQRAEASATDSSNRVGQVSQIPYE